MNPVIFLEAVVPTEIPSLPFTCRPTREDILINFLSPLPLTPNPYPLFLFICWMRVYPLIFSHPCKTALQFYSSTQQYACAVLCWTWTSSFDELHWVIFSLPTKKIFDDSFLRRSCTFHEIFIFITKFYPSTVKVHVRNHLLVWPDRFVIITDDPVHRTFIPVHP